MVEFDSWRRFGESAAWDLTKILQILIDLVTESLKLGISVKADPAGAGCSSGSESSPPWSGYWRGLGFALYRRKKS